MTIGAHLCNATLSGTYAAKGRATICTRPAGHGGHHRDDATRVEWWLGTALPHPDTDPSG